MMKTSLQKWKKGKEGLSCMKIFRRILKVRALNPQMNQMFNSKLSDNLKCHHNGRSVSDVTTCAFARIPLQVRAHNLRKRPICMLSHFNCNALSDAQMLSTVVAFVVSIRVHARSNNLVKGGSKPFLIQIAITIVR